MSGKAEEEDPAWVRLQAKAFQKWVNVYLGMRKMHITNLYKDLGNGVALINLLEVLGGEKVCRKYNKRPKMRIQQLENVGFAFKYLDKKGVQLLNLGPNDVVDGNRKIILALLWTIISKFQIADIKLDGVSGKDGLLLWYKRQVASYEVKVSNFSSSFKDGLAFCALLHKFRPSVVPWDELKGANDPHRALNTAFQVARDHLGVEPLMDAEDVADARRPDEKIVTCYVSFLFQAIGALSKQDQLVGAIHKALDITRKHDTLIASYLEAASASREWVATTEAKYRGSVEGDTLAGVKACLDAFYKYRRAEKPVELAKLSALHNTLNSLHSSQRNNNRPLYVPPEGATVEELTVAWKALEQVEDSYEERIWDTYAKFEVLESTLARFQAKALQVGQWIDKQVAKFNSTDYGSSVAEAETLIEEFKAFEDQRRTFLAVVATLEGWATGDGMDAHRDHTAATSRTVELRAKVADMDAAGAAYHTALVQSLEALQALVAQAKAFNAKSTAYTFAADELEEDIVNEPIPTTSVAAVQSMTDKFEATVPLRLAAVQAMHEELISMAAQLQDAGFEQAFARYTTDSLAARLSKVQHAMDSRREALRAALAEEQRKEGLRLQFAEVAAGFTAYCKHQQAQCAALSGALDEQLASLKALQTQFATEIAEHHAVVQANAAKLAEAGVVTNPHTRENLDSLMARSEELQKYLAQSEEALQGQIIAARAGDVTVEQIKEWKEVFDYFDVDKDDNLNLSEFYSCATGIGLVMSEAEMKEAFESIDTSGDGLVDFDEFTQFMVQRMKDPGFDRDDVQRAFNELAGPGCAGTMTDAQIRRFFGTLYPADADLLTATMPVATDADGDQDGSASVATSSSVGGTSSTGAGRSAGAGAAAAVEGGELTEVVVRNTVAFVDQLFTR